MSGAREPHDWRGHIMSQPESERLGLAIFYLSEITGSFDDRIVFLKEKYDLTPTQARVVIILSEASPRVMTKYQILLALYGPDCQVEDKIVDVFICHIRKKSGIPIKTTWGMGFSLDTPVDLGARSPAISPPPVRQTSYGRMRERADTAWTPEDDQELIRMKENGSDMWCIAEELGRSERACLDRWRRFSSERAA